MILARKLISIIMALCLCIAIIGCGSFAEVEDPDVPGGTIAPADVPARGGSMGIVMPENPGSWNPLLVESREMADLYSLVYDGLVRFDDEMRPIPALALNWTTSDGGATWKFELRKDVKFQNGKPFTAADVVGTLNLVKRYYKDKKTTSIYEGVFDLISSYRAVDDFTVEIKAKNPGHRLISWMDFPILPASYGGANTPPAGTGPYAITKLDKGSSMELTANETGWRRTPYITTIKVSAMPDTATALSSLDVSLVSMVHSTLLTASKYQQKDLINVATLMTQQYECIVPNVYRTAVSDKRMRQAILYAIDRSEVINSIYLNNAVMVDVPVTPDSYLYSSTSFTYEYSVAKAKSLLNDMGFADTNGDGFLEKKGASFQLNLLVNENPGSNTRADAARLIATQLERVGLRTKVSVLPWDKYVKALKNGNFDLAFCGFDIGKDYDVSFFLHSTGKSNYSHFASTKLNDLLGTYSKALTESEIKEASLDLQQYVVKELPVMSLYFCTNSLVYYEMIKGVTMARDMDVYRAIEEWYIYKEGDDMKAGGSQ